MLQQQLLNQGIGFTRQEITEPFPIDNDHPLLSGSDYGLDTTSFSSLMQAWKQWKKFAQFILNKEAGRKFFASFLSRGTGGSWNDYERSELEHYKRESYFTDLHVTRIDFTVTQAGTLRILDPNVMPYGIAPMIATQEILGLESHKEYLARLEASEAVWVCDDHHGGARSVKWLCDYTNIGFAFSKNFNGAKNIIRLSRMPLRGTESTTAPPGIRAIESQLWSALMNIQGLGEAFGFKIDRVLHRSLCTPCYLIKRNGDRILIASGYANGSLEWMSFNSFYDMRWAENCKTVFLKSIYTSGSHQVTFADFKEHKILKSLESKLDSENSFFLLQPALPCLVNNERVRISSYVGPLGEHYASEATRVPAENLLAHGGGHAKISYLTV